jgi:hypothetical protein
MRISRTISMVRRTILAAAGFAIWTSATTAQTLPADAQATAIVPPAQFASWFEKSKPTLDGAVRPADSVNFPNDPGLKNVDFYRWSEQMFLWLTSPVPMPGGEGKIVLNSPSFFAVSLPGVDGKRQLIPNADGRPPEHLLRVAKVGPHGLPVIVGKDGNLLEVVPPKLTSDKKPLVLNAAGHEEQVDKITFDKRTKLPFEFLNNKNDLIADPKPIISDNLRGSAVVQRFTVGGVSVFLTPSGDDAQLGAAQGTTEGVLMAQGGSFVYYMISANDVYAYFMTGTNGGGITPKPTRFPTTPAELDPVIRIAKQQGATLAQPNALCIEVKTSWVEADGLPDTYIKMTGSIPTYERIDSGHWKLTGRRCAKLALVGMHIAGSAKGHPEMIWATFEHFGNSPNASYKYNALNGSTKTVAQSTAGKWLFCQSGATNTTGDFNTLHQALESGMIRARVAGGISASNSIRFKPFGASSNMKPNNLVSDSAESNTQIISMNNSVLGQLSKDDIRRNYFMLGATWTDGSAPGKSFPMGNVAGASQLANSTMETFTQLRSEFSARDSCFSCHTSNAPQGTKVTTGVSQVFASLKPLR